MSRKPKKLSVGFLFDDTLDSNDGVAQYVKTLGAWLNGQGHKVSYMVGETQLKEWAGGRVYSLAKNQTVYFNGNKLSIPLPASRQRITELINSEKFDVLHVMMPHSPQLSQKIIKAAPSEMAVVGTFHIFPSGWLSVAGSRILRRWLRPSLRRIGAVVSVSSAAASFAQKAYGLKTAVIPNPVNISKYRSKSPNQENEIVFLGRLVKRKGAGQLIDAFALLKNSSPAARLTVAGDGPDRSKLEKKVARLGLSDSVRFLGFVDEKDKPALLAGAAIACFPSLYGEAFGIVLIEAMAAGSGVVLGGDNPGYRSVLGEQPETLVDPRDTVAFAARLHRLLSNKALAARLHTWQNQRVKQYDVDVVGRQILELYTQQIARRTKTSNNKAYGKPTGNG
ncbi:MAG TPA: glycosyltransferase family 4 protein [Candidatus Saccharimonadales bacterium]|nr:glycosyltransferase family 4 protein [Candidatus Saccharimonadales bacterium]